MCQSCSIVPGTWDVEVNKKDKSPSLMKPIVSRVRNIHKGERGKRNKEWRGGKRE